jgi:glycosyltransferase involved in cell wall biosynthesis
VPADFRPKFSIVTPSFRQLDWLKLCAASIADQAGVSFEHIIQDAGTGTELESWIQQNTAAQLHVERDAGMYDAINRGLKRAHGEICAYLNCDEQYLPGTLQRVADYFAHHPETDVLFGDAIITDSKLNPLAYRSAMLPRHLHTLLYPLNVLTCSTFFRRKVVDDQVLFDPAWKIIGDKIWLLQLLKRGYRMAVLSEPLAAFALTGANLSQREDVLAERVRWKKSIPTMIRLIGPLVLARHFIEKSLHGAYQIKQLEPPDSNWYTSTSFPMRHYFGRLTLGQKWPSIT